MRINYLYENFSIMLRIALIAWFIFIWIVGCSTNPLFIWVTVVFAVFIVFLPVWCWWHENYSKSFKRQSDNLLKWEREAAIDEWEKKWGRTHPTRLKKTLKTEK